MMERLDKYYGWGVTIEVENKLLIWMILMKIDLAFCGASSTVLGQTRYLDLRGDPRYLTSECVRCSRLLPRLMLAFDQLLLAALRL